MLADGWQLLALVNILAGVLQAGLPEAGGTDAGKGSNQVLAAKLAGVGFC